MEAEGHRPVVIDNGTSMCRVGFAGEEAPRASFPTVVARARKKTTVIGSDQRDRYVGNEAVARRRAPPGGPGAEEFRLIHPVAVPLTLFLSSFHFPSFLSF